MFFSRLQLRNKPLIFILFLISGSLLLSSCEQSVDKSKVIPTLDKMNIKQFTHSFSQDYIKIQKELLTAFHSHKESDDSYGFTRFRNHTWTPIYIEKKKYYQAVLDKNRNYISSTNIKPLFLRFENLIYIGISLKKGLINNDEALINSTLAEAEGDLKKVKAIVK